MFIDRIVEVMLEIRNYSLPVIVEGRKDKYVLSKLGFKKIIDISGKTLEKVVDSIDEKSAAILTDFDKEGNKIASRLIKLFNSRGIKIDFSLRKKIRSIFKINKIEELNSFIKIMGDDYYGKTCSIYDKIFNRGRIFMRRNSRKARYNRRNIRADRRSVRSRS